MAINPISSGAFAPSSSPAALLSFFCSIVFRQPDTEMKPQTGYPACGFCDKAQLFALKNFKANN
jgi:hypothetical protein